MDPQTVGTVKASEILGMSTSYVKTLVNRKEIQAWITPGGHRRIDLESLRRYQSKLQRPMIADHVVNEKKKPVIKVVSENITLSTELKVAFSKWAPVYDISLWNSKQEAYLSFAHKLPDILIVQMSMTASQEVSTIIALKNFAQQARKPIFIVCMSDWSELSKKIRENLIPNVKVVPHTLNTEWLNTFMMGVYAALSTEYATAHDSNKINDGFVSTPSSTGPDNWPVIQP
jgi:excisionase family DNA binding protein